MHTTESHLNTEPWNLVNFGFWAAFTPSLLIFRAGPSSLPFTQVPGCLQLYWLLRSDASHFPNPFCFVLFSHYTCSPVLQDLVHQPAPPWPVSGSLPDYLRLPCRELGFRGIAHLLTTCQSVAFKYPLRSSSRNSFIYGKDEVVLSPYFWRVCVHLRQTSLCPHLSVASLSLWAPKQSLFTWNTPHAQAESSQRAERHQGLFFSTWLLTHFLSHSPLLKNPVLNITERIFFESFSDWNWTQTTAHNQYMLYHHTISPDIEKKYSFN